MASGSPDFDALVQRVRELETHNQRLRALGIAIFTLFCGVILMGQSGSAPRVLEAQKFVLKDNDGNVRGWMGSVGKGSELVLGNVNSQPMIRLIVSTDAADLHFFGNRKNGMNLGLEDGNPDISMVGADGSGSVRIGVKDYGPSFALEDTNGSTAILGVTQPEQVATQPAQSRSAASLVLLNKEKKVIWRMP